MGELYWLELQRSTFGLIRIRHRDDRLDVRLLGFGPALLRFGRPDACGQLERR